MNNSPAIKISAAFGAAILAVGLSSCGGTSDDTTTGGDVGATQPTETEALTPITLTIGTDDDSTTPAGQQITHFARTVSELSDGAITIKPRWHAAGEGLAHWDQAVAELAMDGTLDLAVVPSRSWDAEGVTSLTALNAPFLVDSDELVGDIVSGDIAGQLLSGLPDAGVVGLSMFPEALRHPFGWSKPLLGVGDYAGGQIRTPYSRTTTMVFDALGAKATDDDPDYAKQAGGESSYNLAPAGTATGNVVFYPKVNVLVANAATHEALSDAQQEIVAQAASDTQSWVLDTAPDDVASAQAFCDQAGKIDAASDTQVAELQRATATVTATLEKDQLTADIIDEITALKATVPAEAFVTSCDSPDGDSASAALDGVYKTTLTAAEARAGGVTDQTVIDENAGDFTITMQGGVWKMKQVYATGPSAGQVWRGTGDFKLEHGHLTWYWGHGAGEWTSADATLRSNGMLVFTKVDDGGDANALALSKVTFDDWKRVGDAK